MITSLPTAMKAWKERWQQNAILRAVTPAEFQIIEILGSKVTLLDH